MKVLCVAEKPSIAKAVANILSQRVQSRQVTQYIRNYDLEYGFPFGHAQVTVTAVSGHLTKTDFVLKGWTSCAPADLFDNRIETTPGDEKIYTNISREARYAQVVMIWTDCDREGEYIGWEVVTAAQKYNARITIKRAVFSNLERNHIVHAANHPVALDMNQVDAVAARIELDLRTGAAFTRLQTVQLKPILEAMISYGSCQYPTLGFIVDRYRKATEFRIEPYWAIKLLHQATFLWKRGVLYDRLSTLIFFTLMDGKALVKQVTSSPKSKWKPLPLTTVELQKLGTKFLRMSSAHIMDLAEKLYQKGFISYPRTETDQFPEMDLRALVQKQTSDATWGQYAANLDFSSPRRGRNNDKAHPPIHPICHVTAQALTRDEHRVYEYITRRFLACCSKDATGAQSEVTLEIAEEEFSAKGLVVYARNYLDIYPYDKWQSTEPLPDLKKGEWIEVQVEMYEGHTKPPTFLTEPELIGLMDANGIGTDATMANHIETILTRQYAVKEGIYFLPTSLGVGLVTGYENMGFQESLTHPALRKTFEAKLKMIHLGQARKSDVVREFVDEYRSAFLRVERQIGVLKSAIKTELER